MVREYRNNKKLFEKVFICTSEIPESNVNLMVMCMLCKYTLNLAHVVIILLGQGSGWGMKNILAPKWGMTEKVWQPLC